MCILSCCEGRKLDNSLGITSPSLNKEYYIVLLFTSGFRDFTIPRRDGNENVKNNNRFSRQNNNFARASHGFVHFFIVFAQLRREIT